MNKLKRLARPLGISAAVIAVAVMLGFVERTADRTVVKELRIHVEGAEGVHFIDEASVRRDLVDQGVEVMGATLGDIDLAVLEQRLRNNPGVAEAELYHTMDGTVHVKVRQREPIVRVINRDGSSFYIDREGYVMPTSERYTARVPVVLGHVQEPGAELGVYHVHASDSLREQLLSDDIHRLALFIRNDAFWSAMVDHVVVTPAGEFELVPKVGAQRILIGDATQLEQRFDKLRTFYAKGMPRADWRRYARIDLRFADQIVCTQRTTP